MFDPALSDPNTTLPARLELLISDVDLENPTYADVEDENFTVTHYGKVMKIFSDLAEWDEDNTEMCAALYNTVSSRKNHIIPVTVATPAFSLWEVYYMRVSRVRSILRDDPAMENSGYEVLPDPTYIEDGMLGWYFQHRMRMCVACYQQCVDKGYNPESVSKCNPLVTTSEHRQVALCKVHRAERNNGYAASRVKRLG